MVETTKKLEKVDLDAKSIQLVVDDDDKEALEMVQNRFDAMRDARAKKEAFWDWVDWQYTTAPSYKWSWMAIPNLKMEEALIEASVWMQDTALPITVEADGRADWVQTALAKYTLDHFIYKEEIVQELKLRMDYTRARYWTAVLYSGMELRSKYVASDKQDKWYFNPKGNVERLEELHVVIKDVPIRNAYFDDTATRFKDAVDCIYEEWLSIDEYKLRYLDDDGKSKEYFTNAEYVGTTDGNSQKWPWTQNKSVKHDMVKLWHYYNKLYAKYVIVVNESVVIYNGLASTKHGELPLIPVQFYNNPFSLYGIWIPERYAMVKGLNQNFYQAMVWWAWLNAWTAVIMSEWADVDWWIFLEPGEVNIIQMTKGSARDATPFNANVNVQQLVEIIQFMDDIWSYLTWVNIKAPYTSPATTAFEVSVMKEEQNNRLKTIYDTRVLWIEQAFTLMLSNIFTFLPYQYADRMIDEQEKLGNWNWYQIPVKDKKIYRNDDGSLSLEEERWTTDYFDLSPEIVEGARGMKVRVVTTQTASTMKALEIENLTRYLQAKAQIMQFKAQAIQIGEDPSQWEKISERLDVLFNIDKENIDITSNEQKQREKLADVTDILSQFSFTWEQTTPDETANPNAMEQTLQGEPVSTGEQESLPTVQEPVDPLQQYLQSWTQD